MFSKKSKSKAPPKFDEVIRSSKAAEIIVLHNANLAIAKELTEMEHEKHLKLVDLAHNTAVINRLSFEALLDDQQPTDGRVTIDLDRFIYKKLY